MLEEWVEGREKEEGKEARSIVPIWVLDRLIGKGRRVHGIPWRIMVFSWPHTLHPDASHLLSSRPLTIAIPYYYFPRIIDHV